MTSAYQKWAHSRKPYEKPAAERQELFERFTKACCKSRGACGSGAAFTSTGSANKS